MVVIGAMQSTIIICGVLLRPIIIRPGMSNRKETDGAAPTELDVLSAQKIAEDTNPEDSTTNKISHATSASYSLDKELTGGSASTADSGVHCIDSVFGGDNGGTEEKTLLHKDAGSDTEKGNVGNSEAGIKEAEAEEEKDYTDPEKQRMKDEEDESGGETPPPKNSKLLDFSILRECNFILYCLFGLFATLGFFAPQLYIIELSVSRGVERDRATYMLSTMAVAEILGRFAIGWILTRERFMKRKLLVLLLCVIIMTADLVGFTLVTEFYGLAVCCALYGFFMGTLACTHIPILAEDDVVGIERMSSAAGVYVFIQSFAGLAGPPLGGKRYLLIPSFPGYRGSTLPWVLSSHL